MSAMNGPQIKLPGHTAAADLRTKQYTAVKLAGSRTVNAFSGADNAVGILVNKPNTGEAAEIVVMGEVECLAGETLVSGARVTFSAAGKAMNDAGSNYGFVMDGGAADDLVTIFINCVNLAVA